MYIAHAKNFHSTFLLCKLLSNVPFAYYKNYFLFYISLLIVSTPQHYKLLKKVLNFNLFQMFILLINLILRHFSPTSVTHPHQVKKINITYLATNRAIFPLMPCPVSIYIKETVFISVLMLRFCSCLRCRRLLLLSMLRNFRYTLLMHFLLLYENIAIFLYVEHRS